MDKQTLIKLKERRLSEIKELAEWQDRYLERKIEQIEKAPV